MKKRILALDYGNKRIGVAITDALYFTAQTRPFMTNKGYENVLKALQEYTENYPIAKIVIGIPLGLSGSDTEQTKIVRLFKSFLEKHMTLPVVFHDESFTTKEAEELLIFGGMSRKKRKQKKDSLAAQLILQSYMIQYPFLV